MTVIFIGAVVVGGVLGVLGFKAYLRLTGFPPGTRLWLKYQELPYMKPILTEYVRRSSTSHHRVRTIEPDDVWPIGKELTARTGDLTPAECA